MLYRNAPLDVSKKMTIESENETSHTTKADIPVSKSRNKNQQLKYHGKI